jgi:hypothetical protein
MTKIQCIYGGASAASDGFPQMRDKMLQMLFELLSWSGLGAHDMQTHAYACPGMLLTKNMPWSRFSMLICMPVETIHAQAISSTATMSQGLHTAKYAGLDLRMKSRCRLSGSGPYYLLVIVVFHLLIHYPPLSTNGVRLLVCKLSKSQKMACEVDTSQISIHTRGVPIMASTNQSSPVG